MSKKKFNSSGGLVYSTDPGFKPEENNFEEPETLLPAIQKIMVRLDTRNRAGKVVTLIQGFIGKIKDREELGKQLKTFCGTGGSVKGDEIIVQGDNRHKVIQWLQKNGYAAVRKL